ncbi:MAG: YggS family pyridoxal phosphate-dependent enzyme [Pyrinomonadaceae bacterium]|nr:YggS family pyridoxal phosphate-dependent enzyme [Pyrinomonadaceae bacterium]
MPETNFLRENLSEMHRRIESAAHRVGRNPNEITLISVSKTFPVDVLQNAIAAGATDLGENKVQEAETKVAEIGRDKARWHLIGNLQANKARKAVRTFDLIHTLDSVDLAQRLERICAEEKRESLEVLIQIDLAHETTKSGIDERDLPQLVETLRNCEHLKLRGLMIIPPFLEDVEKIRPYFKRLREIRNDIFENERAELSMGMTNDFETAIEEGATMIRVGTAIFGRRTKPQI